MEGPWRAVAHTRPSRRRRGDTGRIGFACVATTLIAIAVGCAARTPADAEQRSTVAPARDLTSRIAAADARLDELRARTTWPSAEDRARFSDALQRAVAARRRAAQDADPDEAHVAALEAAIADAWQLHRIYRVGEDARTPR